MIQPSARFDFSRHLDSPVAPGLSDATRWRWISTLLPSEGEQTRHARHAGWIRVHGNTHAPAHREVMVTLRGNAIYWLEDVFYHRSPGTVILLNQHERRDLKGAPWKRDFSCLWLQLHGRNRVTYFLNHCDAQGLYRHEAPLGIVCGELVQLLNEAWDHCAGHPDDAMGWSLLRSAVSVPVLTILGSAAPAPANGMQREIIRSVIDYIETHPAEKLGLHRLAGIAGYSPHHFHRLFCAYAGQTPVAFVNAARFRRSQDLLRQGLSVEAAAEASGYASTSYFSDFFKLRAGLSPGAWRLTQVQTNYDSPPGSGKNPKPVPAKAF